MSSATALDHVGVAGPDLATLAAAWERLGFTLTPRARHAGRRTPDGPVEAFGTGNRCIMLREGYVELIAVVDPTAFNTLEDTLARYAGLHIIALEIEDEAASLQRLRLAGLDIPGVAYLERPVDDADPTGLKARFARLPLPRAPEGTLQLIRHLTPEAIWQEGFLHHANRAVALESVVMAVASPAATSMRLSVLAGLPVVPDPLGGYALPLPRGMVRMLPPEALGSVFPGAEVPALPFIAGLVLRTGDGNLAARRLLAERGVPHADLPAGLLVGAEATGGASLLFAPG